MDALKLADWLEEHDPEGAIFWSLLVPGQCGIWAELRLAMELEHRQGWLSFACEGRGRYIATAEPLCLAFPNMHTRADVGAYLRLAHERGEVTGLEASEWWSKWCWAWSHVRLGPPAGYVPNA